MSFSGTLGELCAIEKGNSPTLKTEPGKYPLVVTAEYRRSASTYQFDRPAVCIPLISSTGHGDAAIHRIHFQEGRFALANLLVALIPRDQSVCFPRYLYLMLQAQKDHLLVPLMRGTANVSLKEKDIASVQVTLPPLSEQKKIVEWIDAVATRVEEAKRLNEHAINQSETFSSIISRVIETATTNIEASTLAEHIDSHDSGWSPQCSESPATGDEWAVLKTTCVQWDAFHPEENKSLLLGMMPRPKLAVEPGDVLITRAGPVNRVGVACVVKEQHSRLMLSDKIVRLRTKSNIDPEYLAMFLRTPSAQEYFRQGKTGLAESQVNISRNKLLGLPIKVPSQEEQFRLKSYVQRLQQTLAIAKVIQEDIEFEIKAIVPSLLNQVFNGQTNRNVNEA